MENYYQNSILAQDTFAQHLGIEVVEITGNTAIASMPFDHRHRNGMGNTHGGAIFALADIAFAAAAHAYHDITVNAQSSISYLSPGKVGPLKGVAKPVKLGNKLVTYEVTITDATDITVAVALITGYVKGKKQGVTE